MADEMRRSSRLSSRKIHAPPSSDVEQPPALPPAPTKVAKKSRAQASKEYRERLKLERPDEYARQNEMAKIRNKKNRDNASDESKKAANEKTKVRMANYRERKSAETAEKMTTRGGILAHEAQKAKWRADYLKRSAAMSSQKRTAINTKRRKKYTEKKVVATPANPETPPPTIPATSEPSPPTDVATSEPSPPTNAASSDPSPPTDAASSDPSPPTDAASSDPSPPTDAGSSESPPPTVAAPTEPPPPTVAAPAEEPQPPTVTSPVDARSAVAKRKALQRVRSHLTANKAAAVNTLASTVKTLTPKSKEKFLQKAGLGEEVEVGRSVIKSLQECSDKSSSSACIRRSLFPHLDSLPDSKKSRFTKTCRRTIKRLREKRKKLRPESVNLAEEFLRQRSVTLPHKRCVSKKTGEVKTFLQQTLRQLHTEFLAERNSTLSFSSFATCRPVSVRLLNSATFNMCLCEYCTNVWLKVTALNRHAKLSIRGEVEAVKTTVCSLDNKSCTHRECPMCGVDNFPAGTSDQQISWHKWEMKDVTFKDNQIKRKVLTTKTGPATDLVTELKKELTFLSEHLFRARYQHARFLESKESASEDGMAVMVLDFAENFTCVFQNEVQSAHWHHQQVTIHPTVVYYKCIKCSKVMTESVVAISDDLTHDYHAVHEITKQTLSHLQRTRRLALKSVHMWSDGCASQYKSKGPFADLAHFWQDFGVSAERHYFGSRHGKGASDGESAVVKSAATRAIKASQAVISTPDEMFAFCKGRLEINADSPCKHFLRHFIYVPTDSIKRDRVRQAMPIKGSQKLHWLKPDKDGNIQGSYLSCCCPGTCSQQCKDATGPKKIFKHDTAVGVHAAPREGDNSDNQTAHKNVNGTTSNVQLQEPATSQDTETETERDNMVCGSWVIAMFPSKKGQRKYLGTILQRDGPEAHVKFARQSGDHFIWPAVEDLGWMPHYALVTIDAPDLDAREHMFLTPEAKKMFDS